MWRDIRNVCSFSALLTVHETKYVSWLDRTGEQEIVVALMYISSPIDNLAFADYTFTFLLLFVL